MLGEMQRSVAQRPYPIKNRQHYLVMNVSPVAIDTHSYAFRPRRGADLQLAAGETIFTTGLKFAQSGLLDMWPTGALHVTSLVPAIVDELLNDERFTFIKVSLSPRGAGFVFKSNHVMQEFIKVYEEKNRVERAEVNPSVQHEESDAGERVHSAAGGGSQPENGPEGDGVPAAAGLPEIAAAPQQDGSAPDQAAGADVRSDGAHEADGGAGGSGENGGETAGAGDAQSAPVADERGRVADDAGASAGSGSGAGAEDRGGDTGGSGPAGRESDSPAQEASGGEDVLAGDPIVVESTETPETPEAVATAAEPPVEVEVKEKKSMPAVKRKKSR